MKSGPCIAILLAEAAFLASFSAAAQPAAEIGFKGGVGLASLSTEATGWVLTVRGYEFDAEYTDNFEAGVRTGFQVGGFICFDMSENLSLQMEMMYVSKGAQVEGVGTYDLDGSYSIHELSEEIKLTYLEVPVLVKYRLPMWGSVRPSLFAGPALAFNLSASDDITMTSSTGAPGSAVPRTTTGEPEITNIRSSDLSFVLGTDLRIPVGRAGIILDLRYQVGASEAFEDINPESIPYIDHRAVTFPDKYPMAARGTGKAPDMKNIVFSFTMGVSVPM